MASSNPTSKDNEFSVVAAIDFGTTYSGYAYSTVSGPRNIKLNHPWGSGLGVTTDKAPTCLLTDENDKFIAFGYEALSRYASADSRTNTLHLYDRIKMMLYKEQVASAKTTVVSKSGRVRPAEQIIAHILQYLYTHIVERLQKANASTLDVEQIRWVLTVPAIWSEGAKQLMRRAAWKARIIDSLSSKRLVIALEPESASFWCRNLPLDQFTQTPDSNQIFQGKYVVVDCGGGTVDITAHDKTPDGKIKEIHRATGGDWGATKIEDAILDILNTVFGTPFLKGYKVTHPKDWVKLCLQIEATKRSILSIIDDAISISPTYKFGSTAEKNIGKPLQDIVADAKILGVTFDENEGTLTVGGLALQQIFSSVTNKVLDHLDDLLSKPNLEHVELMYLVGGFSECDILQTTIKQKFGSNIAILVPQDAGIAVLKGAVLYGHDPGVVESRVARRTYGDEIRKPFLRGVHDPDKLILNAEGKERCTDIFRKWVKKGESVKTGEVRTFGSRISNQNFTWSSSYIYMTDKDNVMYTTEPGVYRIGNLKINIPDTHVPRQKRNINTHVYFGGTELHVQYIDAVREDGDTAETTIDFLADDE